MKLRWDTETNGNHSQHYLLKLQTATTRPFLPAHTHDYAELVLVETGSCIHQVNGRGVRVKEGDVLFIYPETVEHCYCDWSSDLRIIQILFPQEGFRFMRDRYAQDLPDVFRENASNPLVGLDPAQQNWFERNYQTLLADEGALINLERFLLDFFFLLRRPKDERFTPGGEWLDRALKEIQKPGNFSQGHKGFISLCSFSTEHVEREVKKRTGRTVTNIVNLARMAWASYMLTFTRMSVVDISYDCGFESVSYFYKLFQEHHGTSPARYRKQTGQLALAFDDRLLVP